MLPEFSRDAQWVAYFALGAFVVLAFFASHVFLSLTAVRPFLVFVPVDGHAPPVCGLSVLFGT